MIIWLMCGLIGYLYFGIKTKWEGRKYNTKFDDSLEIIICSLCGIYTLVVVILTKY
jgi:hypothetical protein